GTDTIDVTDDDVAPTITSANSASFSVGFSGSFTVTTTGAPTPALSVSGALPSGVTFVDLSDGTATLAGTPAPGSDGNYPLTITAANGVAPDATQNFTLMVEAPGLDLTPPVIVITSPQGDAGYLEGQSGPRRSKKDVLGIECVFVDNPFDLAGTVADDFGLTRFSVTLNGIELPLDAPLSLPQRTMADSPLAWSASGVEPQNGPNTIVVEAEDYDHRVVRKTFKVCYEDPNLAALAGNYEALVKPLGTPELDTFGLVKVKVDAKGAFSGSVALAGTVRRFSGYLDNDGWARFKPDLGDEIELTIGRGSAARSLGYLWLKVDSMTGLSGGLWDGMVDLATFAGARSPYGKKMPVPDELLNRLRRGKPVSGAYNVAFPSRETDSAVSPTGDGLAGLTLGSTGTVSLRGYLADGTKLACSAKLREGASAALFAKLYRNAGAVGGELAFDPMAADSDVAGMDWLWLRPATPTSTLYPAGWPDGVWLDALGTFYAKPQSLDFGQGAADPDAGNADLVFEDGKLTSVLTRAVSVDPATGAVARPIAGTDYTLKLNAKNGQFSGKFPHSDGTNPGFRGILLNKGMNRGGFGYFLSNGTDREGGGVTLDPDGP
ncbi:MAG: hypothetical protein KDM91_03450, partial [Verrucomicrobiae bacterium]|nr:hypothetical protein [Verrucomicrobiae bacterium]